MILIIFDLGFLLPTIGVQIRRLHDSGRSGLYLLLMFIPIIGWIILIILLCQDSDDTNKYGPSPKDYSAHLLT